MTGAGAIASSEGLMKIMSVAATAAMLALIAAASGAMAQSEIERGRYLVTIAGCSDCHTPGTFLGRPDMTRYLGGSDVGFNMPGLGIFAGPNMTPDKETGIGDWSAKDIVAAITTGTRPDGRMLAPIMPYQALSQLTAADAEAIAAYLKSIKPVSNKVAGPFGPNEKPTIFVFTVMPGDAFAALPKAAAK